MNNLTPDAALESFEFSVVDDEDHVPQVSQSWHQASGTLTPRLSRFGFRSSHRCEQPSARTGSEGGKLVLPRLLEGVLNTTS